MFLFSYNSFQAPRYQLTFQTPLQAHLQTRLQAPLQTPLLTTLQTSPQTPPQTPLRTSPQTPLQTPLQTPPQTPLRTSPQTRLQAQLQTPLQKRLLTQSPSPPPTQSPRILFEDRDYVFVHKPSGMATMGEATDLDLHRWIKEKYGGQYFLPHVLHVLDRVASGVLVFGKHRAAENHFRTLKSKGRGVVYGIVVGVQGRVKPLKGKVKANIMKTPKDMRRFSLLRRGGKPMELDFICLSKFSSIPTSRKWDTTNNKDRTTGNTLERTVTAADNTVTAKDRTGTTADRTGTTADRTGTTTDRTGTTADQTVTATDQTRTSTDKTETATDRFGRAVVAINNITEKQHQVRAACSAMHIPIIGDPAYGGISFPVTLYHACYIKFPKFLQEGIYEIFSIPDWPTEFLTKVTQENIKLVWEKSFREEFKIVPIGKQRSFKKNKENRDKE